MRYISLAQALLIAEAVTGTEHSVLAKGTGISLLDSALHAPGASFAGQEMYPDFIDKVAVLAVRVARNHPLPDGNKRLAWGCMTMFCLLNGRDLCVETDDAVSQMLGVAAGEIDEADMAAWLAPRLTDID